MLRRRQAAQPARRCPPARRKRAVRGGESAGRAQGEGGGEQRTGTLWLESSRVQQGLRVAGVQLTAECGTSPVGSAEVRLSEHLWVCACCKWGD